MGEMLQNISHQWRQPLSEINAVMMKIDADFYKKRLTSDSLEEDITKVEMLTRHMSETISSFNNYLKVNSQNSDTLVNLEEIVKQAIRILDTRLKDIQVDVEAEKLESMQLNSSDLIQVLHVLLANAVDTFESRDQTSKIITIRLKKRDEKVLIEVEDNAGGVESKNLEKIFEPYFTTKFQSDGIGIGLYMARMLVENSLGGQIYVQNTKTGAKFSIEI
jgi:C4-dicarboxylate-specific signal transduction histidine kinase